MERNDVINFKALEKELQAALAADEKYKRENAAKLRAVEQRVPSYEEFRLACNWFPQALLSWWATEVKSKQSRFRSFWASVMPHPLLPDDLTQAP